MFDILLFSVGFGCLFIVYCYGNLLGFVVCLLCALLVGCFRVGLPILFGVVCFRFGNSVVIFYMV